MHWFLKFILEMKLYMFRTVPLSIIRSFFYCTHSNGICHTCLLTACKRDHNRIEFHPDPALKLSANLYDIHHCCAYSEKTPDDEQRNCLKHVEFHSKNKFEKLMYLVGFNIRHGNHIAVWTIRESGIDST
jgi:hypothetical protein